MTHDTWFETAVPSLGLRSCLPLQVWASPSAKRGFHVERHKLFIQYKTQVNSFTWGSTKETATCCSGLVDWPHDNGGMFSTVASSEVFPSVILSFPLTLESKPSLNVTLLYWFQIKDQLHIESLLYYAHTGKKKLYFSTCFCFSKKIRGIISQIFIISSKVDMS